MHFLAAAVFAVFLTGVVGRVRSFYCMRDSKSMNSSTALEKLTQDLLCEVDTYKRPVKDQNKVVYVTVRFQPMFFDIMDQEELIRMSGYLELSWIDENLKWSPSKYSSINEFEANYYDVWYPRLTTYDTGTIYRFLDESDRHRFEDVNVKYNGTATLRSTSNLYGPCEFDAEEWPFEEWTCTFILARTSYQENMVQVNDFRPEVNIDTSSMKGNKKWKIVSNPQFSRSSKTQGVIEISVTLQRHESHYQRIFIFPGIALLTLSLVSFWLSNKIYCRLVLNMLTTLVQLTFLQRMFVMLDNNGSKGVLLYSFFLDIMFTSFVGLLTAVINAKLITRSTDPPQYVTEIIGIVAVIPIIGPVFSYLVYDDINSSSALEDDEVGLVSGLDTKSSQKWRVISNFIDKTVFLLIVTYFFIFYLLRIALSK